MTVNALQPSGKIVRQQKYTQIDLMIDPLIVLRCDPRVHRWVSPSFWLLTVSGVSRARSQRAVLSSWVSCCTTFHQALAGKLWDLYVDHPSILDLCMWICVWNVCCHAVVVLEVVGVTSASRCPLPPPRGSSFLGKCLMGVTRGDLLNFPPKSFSST